jgi:hypothetical protein
MRNLIIITIVLNVYLGINVFGQTNSENGRAGRKIHDSKILDSGLDESEKTQILILGASHLQRVKNCLEPNALTGLLDILESYKPDVIGVETMPPAVIADMQRRGGFFGEILGAFAEKQISLGQVMQKKLNVSRREAEILSDKLVNRSNPLDHSDRLKLIAHLLAAYDFDSAVLQWSYLPESLQKENELIPKSIGTVLSETQNSANERFSLGTRLAKRIRLQRVYGIDDHYDEELLNRMIKPFVKEIEDNPEVKKVTSSELYAETEKSLRKGCQNSRKMLDHFQMINSADYGKKDADLQWGVWFRTKLPSRLDRSRVAQWEVRNLNIASRIREISVFNPGKKILIIIGVGHKPFLDRYLTNMLDVQVIHLNDLAPTARDRPRSNL